MKEIRASELIVGDVVYNCISVNAGWTYIGAYYRKEVVKRITPKRTKVVTDHGECKGHYRFYEYSEEIEEINKETMDKKEIHNLGFELDNLISRDEKFLDIHSNNASRVCELLRETVDILRGGGKKCN